MHTVNDLVIMAKTIYGEARGETILGKYAVGCVIYNRWKKDKGKTIEEICLQPWQFSCWNYNDPNKVLLMNENMPIDRKFGDSLHEASYILLSEGKHKDATNGATHYHAKSIKKPYWAKGKEPCYSEGNHVFYNNID